MAEGYYLATGRPQASVTWFAQQHERDGTWSHIGNPRMETKPDSVYS